MKYWATISGCHCVPENAQKGDGYDLRCKCRHIEVKGTTKRRPGFRLFTGGEYETARRDRAWQVWIVADLDGTPQVYVIPRDDFLREARREPVWRLPLGKRRLEQFQRAVGSGSDGFRRA